MRLRKYKKDDAIEIVKWIKTEREKALWSADRYKNFPVTPEDINTEYENTAKVCNFYPMTLTDGNKIVGHIILRNPTEDKSIFRFGYVIVSSSIRGKGYGKTLLLEAIRYAKGKLGAKKITLGVFIENESAVKCYEAVGFKIVDVGKETFKFKDEKWSFAEMEYQY